MRSIFEILEEATDSAGPDLMSLADLKLALGITGTSEDEALSAALTFQSRIIADYCDRRLGRAQALERFIFDRRDDGCQWTWEGRPALPLRLYPVEEIIEISTQGATDLDYELDAEAGLLFGDFLLGGWPGEISVVYSGGYDLPEEAPARLQRALIESVAAVRLTTGAGVRDPTIREVQHGDTRISYVTASFATGAVTANQHLSPSVADLIKPYRRFYIA